MFSHAISYRRWVPRALAPLAVLALAASACGNDDENPAATQSVGVDSGADETTTTEPAATEEESPADTEEESAEPTDSESLESEEDPGALLLIMDSSGSMNEVDAQGQTLLEGAKAALRDLIGVLPEEQHVGLRVYGHTYPNTAPPEQACTDTELIHPVEPLNREALLTAIDGFEARGYTPIGLSLQAAAEDLPPEGPRTIALVSDGIDTCAPPDPCQVAEDLTAQGVEVVINTVGFALDQAAGDDAAAAREQLQCIADAGNGTFVDVEDADQLADALDDVAREDRSFEASGTELAGAPIPRDANTGQLGTAHTDTVLGTETNYYRFEVTPGTTVSGEAVIEADPNISCGTLPPTLWARLTDEGGSIVSLMGRGHSFDDPSEGAVVARTDPTEMEDTGEVWLEVETECSNAPDAELNIELRVE